MLSVGILGVNHKTAGLALREELARSAASLPPFFPYPLVLLSTCNRMEIYFHADDLAEGQRHLLAHFRKTAGILCEQSFYSFFGMDCFFHLCKVAAGLDSAIFAESEIQRQVRIAYAQGKQLPSCLHFLFQKALKVSKEVRSKQLKQDSPTLYSALWRLADWREQRILLVGFSEINRGLIAFLQHKGVAQITLCTRGSVQIEGVRVGERSLLKEWPHYGVIVCAAQAEDYLIGGSGGQKNVIFDLGVPRNVDPHVDATVYNIEQVNRWIEAHRPFPKVVCFESLIRQQVMRLSQIYRLKTQHVRESEEMELRL